MSTVRHPFRCAIMFAALACVLAPAATAGDGASTFEKGLSNVVWADHPGAAIAAIAGMILAGLAASAGVGCAVALFGAVVPKLRDMTDAAARPAFAGRVLLVGSLSLGGVLLAMLAADRTGVSAISGTVGVALGVPALLLFVLGALGGVPLLGERLLGPRGAEASPIRRCVTATVAIGLSLLPAFAFGLHLLGILVGLIGLAWPLGVGIQTVVQAFPRFFRRRLPRRTE